MVRWCLTVTNEAYDLKLSEIIKKCHYPEIAKEKLDITFQLLQEADIHMTQLQKLTLSSHICAMVNRNFDGGEIPPIDKEMFKDVSAHSIGLALEICQLLPNLPEDEKYLLSIHFEAAKMGNG